MKKSALEEVMIGSREAAAAIALGTEKKLRFPVLKQFLIVVIALLLIIIGAFTYFKLFTGTSNELDTFTIVEGVQELATLATAEASVTTVIKEEDNKLFNKEININFPGTKRTILFIVPAAVIAGVDLTSVSEDNIVINEEKKEIILTIPHATLIQEPSIQMDRVKTYSEEGIFRSEVKWDEGFNLAEKASSEIKKEAIELGLLTKAEESAVKVLSNFFSQLGYSTKIEFK